MRLLFICAAAVLLIYPFTIAHADDGYWIKVQLRTGPLPGAENKAEDSRSEQTFTMYCSDRYIRIDQHMWDEYSEKQYGDKPSSMSMVFDLEKGRQYTIDHDSKRVTFKEFEAGHDKAELISNPFLAPFGEPEPGRSFAEVIEKVMDDLGDKDAEYITTDLGERIILGFPAQGVLIEPVPEEETDSSAEDSGVGGALSLGVGAIAEALASGDVWYEYWYCEDLGMFVLMRMTLFGGLLEIEALEYEPWSPTAEEMALPEDYELVYETTE